jgi:hypothetical protein
MNKYLVALQTGGLMEDPEIRYSDHQTIEAESKQDAQQLYNKKNKCSYFYGCCLLGWEKGKIVIFNDQVTQRQINDFEKACQSKEASVTSVKQFIHDEFVRLGFEQTDKYFGGGYVKQEAEKEFCVRVYQGDYTLWERRRVANYGESTGWLTGFQTAESIRYFGPLVSHTFFTLLLDNINWRTK